MATTERGMQGEVHVPGTDKKKTNGEKDKTKAIEIYCAIGAELLLILLPFVVISIVFAYRGESRRIMSTPEWALAAAVLMGQSVTRLAGGTVGRSNVYPQRVVLAIAIIIVAFLVPSLLVLGFVLTSEKVSTGLALAQLILFAVGLLAFALMTYTVRDMG